VLSRLSIPDPSALARTRTSNRASNGTRR
jgi:hypothetical protein